MSNTKPIPGPWETYGYSTLSRTGIRQRHQPGAFPFASVRVGAPLYETGPEISLEVAEATARQIVAAPDLADALRAVLACKLPCLTCGGSGGIYVPPDGDGDVCPDCDGGQGEWHLTPRVVRQVRAALQLADTGERPAEPVYEDPFAGVA